MEKIYLIFILVIILIIYYLFQKSENFVVKNSDECIKKCKSKQWSSYDELNDCINECYK